MLDDALKAKKDEIAAILKDYGVPLVQCSDCIVSGDIPSHGSYDKQIAKKYADRYLKSAEARPATNAAAPDQVVSTERLELLARRRRRHHDRAQQRGARF